MTDPAVEWEQLRAMTPEQQAAWLKREERKVWWLHVAGWCMLMLAGLFITFSLVKTWVLYGHLAMLQALMGHGLVVGVCSCAIFLYQWVRQRVAR